VVDVRAVDVPVGAVEVAVGVVDDDVDVVLAPASAELVAEALVLVDGPLDSPHATNPRQAGSRADTAKMALTAGLGLVM
jgi:hypothetical protein